MLQAARFEVQLDAIGASVHIVDSSAASLRLPMGADGRLMPEGVALPAQGTRTAAAGAPSGSGGSGSAPHGAGAGARHGNEVLGK